jgi:hypothetical protein
LLNCIREVFKNFIISEVVKVTDYPKLTLFLVGETLEALQRLAGFHRKAIQYTRHWHYRQQWKNDRKRMVVPVTS